MAKNGKNGNGKLTEKDFVLKAIEAAKNGKYKGVHTVYSGFNDAFRQYFGKSANPVKATTALAEAGVISVRFCRGGATMYLPADAPPPARDEKAKKLLAAITG